MLGKHKNTVRAWIKEGLPVCDSKRPTLILGQALRDFLLTKKNKHKRPCAPGEMYCVRCRAPQKPAEEMADYQPVTKKYGNLIGICPACDCVMYRRASFAKIEQIRGQLDITFAKAARHIDESAQPSVNSDFNLEALTHGNAQPQ